MTVHQFIVEEKGRLDSIVAQSVEGVSRSRAANLVREGHVQVESVVVCKPSHTVLPGQGITLQVPKPTPMESVAQDIPLEIVFEDADILVVNKAAGMVVHPAPGHPDKTLVNALLHHVEDLSGIGGVLRPGIVHRLDKGTTGLMVVAKHDAAHHDLSEQFSTHAAGRQYLALCHGSPKIDEGTIHTRLARHPRDRKRWASIESGGKEAITHWSVITRKGTIFLVQCRLETGRTHQIRVHLTESGWPLVGDPVYTNGLAKLPATLKPLIDLGAQRPLLHAWQLSLKHPATQAPLRFRVPLPEDFTQCLNALGVSFSLPL